VPEDEQAIKAASEQHLFAEPTEMSTQ